MQICDAVSGRSAENATEGGTGTRKPVGDYKMSMNGRFRRAHTGDVSVLYMYIRRKPLRTYANLCEPVANPSRTC
eukprot:3443321-Prymnesium_polylepis.1